MTILTAKPEHRSSRSTRQRHYLMCAPTYFDVTYAINPWMDPHTPIDADKAYLQWDILRNTYLALGHKVDIIDPEPGLPDMVFAANGGLVVGGRAYTARFTFPQRSAEGPAYQKWFLSAGLIDVHEAAETNEGEGDFLALANVILAGTGFRTTIAAHIEAAAVLDRAVVSLELVDPRFYHLDTALAVLENGFGSAPAEIAYFPAAFSMHSQQTLRQLFPSAVIVNEADACAFGLNAVSDGYNVVLPRDVTDMADQLCDRGYNPVGVDLSEFLRSGGSVKCCTLELHQ